MKRLEHVGFDAEVHEPPENHEVKNGRGKREVWDYGDNTGPGGSEEYRVAIYLDEKSNEVVLVGKSTGIRHRARNWTFYREYGEQARAKKAWQEEEADRKRKAAAKAAAEAPTEPEPTLPSTPAAKRKAPKPSGRVVQKTASGASVSVERGVDDEDAAE